MKGDIVWESGTYTETVIEEENGVQLVDCSGGGYSPLWRIDYQEDGQNNHKATHCFNDAMEIYNAIAQA
jgi:hypothetical protein